MDCLKQRPHVLVFIDTVAKQLGMDKYVIGNFKTNDKGEGYLGQIYLMTITNATSKKSLDIIVKVAFEDEKIRDFVPIKEAFLNEIFFYTEVYPMLKKFEAERTELPIKFVPTCYRVLSDEKKEMLCLEDLKSSNFEMFDKKLTLDEEHVTWIFQNYGRFHAYSLALKDQTPDLYSFIASKLYNFYEELVKGKFKEHLQETFKEIDSYLVQGEDDDLKAKFEKYSNNGIVQLFTQCVTEISAHSTILHGDCWSNNMMFKYDATSRKLVDMRFIDLQLIKIGSTVCDLSYCLYSGASKSIFDNLEMYLTLYHKSLSSCLKELGSDPAKVYPFEILKQEWQKFAKFGMMMAFPIIKIKLTNAEDMFDLTDFENMTLDNMKFDKQEYKRRIKELLYHLAEIDAL